jgi:uncharacterized protein YmfQ (DUF2313 family)
MGIAAAESAQYERAVRKLFPQGAYWDKQFSDPASDVSLFAKAKIEELIRYRGRMNALLGESRIETTEELIADWERVLLGEITYGKTLEEQRLLLKSKQDNLLTRAELQKTAGMYGFTIEDIQFPYRPGFFTFSRFGDRLATMASFSVITFTLYKTGLSAACREIIKIDYPLKGFGRMCFGAEKTAYFPFKNFSAEIDDISRFEVLLVNYTMAEKRLFAEFEQALTGKLLANHIPIFYYTGD